MSVVKGWAIVCGLVIVVVAQVAGDYEGQRSEILEGPRVERMHSEISDGCVGSNCLTQSSEGAIGAMWFGPRLGRRRRSDTKYLGKEIEALSEILGSPGFTFITIPDREDKHQEIIFTPREGHELGDTLFMRSLLHKFLDRIEEQLFGQQEEKSSQMMIPSFRSNTNHKASVLEHNFRGFLRKLKPQILNEN